MKAKMRMTNCAIPGMEYNPIHYLTYHLPAQLSILQADIPFPHQHPFCLKGYVLGPGLDRILKKDHVLSLHIHAQDQDLLPADLLQGR